MKLQKFVKERNKALLSFNKSKIMEFMNKYEIPVPKNEIKFWMDIYDVYKEIFQFSSVTDEQKKVVKKILETNGLKKPIKIY